MLIYIEIIFYKNLNQSNTLRSKISSLFFTLAELFLAVFFILVLSFNSVFAQIKSDFGVAYSYKIIDENVEYGDIISYDKEKGLLYSSKKDADKNMFGVVVEDPILLFRTDGEGRMPIVQSGKVLVNVTTINGPIKKGDYISSSAISGKGKKASLEDGYVLGFALESFGDGLKVQEGKIVSGKVLVMVGIEEKKNKENLENSLKIPLFNSDENKGLGKDSGGGNSLNSKSGVNTIKYTVAAIVAIAFIFIALRNFMTVVNKGVVSVGRNPLAKSSVWSIVVLNTIIALVISVIGIFLSLIIISLPF